MPSSSPPDKFLHGVPLPGMCVQHQGPVLPALNWTRGIPSRRSLLQAGRTFTSRVIIITDDKLAIPAFCTLFDLK